MDLPILDISCIILKSFFLYFLNFCFIKRMGCSYYTTTCYRQNRFSLVTEKSGGRWGALTPPERSCPTPLTSPRSGAGPATSHTDCRLPARGCRCPWPRGSAWRNTASADPARTSQRFLSGANAQNLVQLINLFISLSS